MKERWTEEHGERREADMGREKSIWSSTHPKGYQEDLWITPG